MTVITVSIRTAGLGQHLLENLKRSAALLHAKAVVWVMNALSNDNYYEKKAIQTLRSGTAHADEREWAERYLCGLAASDERTFMTDRLYQS